MKKTFIEGIKEPSTVVLICIFLMDKNVKYLHYIFLELST